MVNSITNIAWSVFTAQEKKTLVTNSYTWNSIGIYLLSLSTWHWTYSRGVVSIINKWKNLWREKKQNTWLNFHWKIRPSPTWVSWWHLFFFSTSVPDLRIDVWQNHSFYSSLRDFKCLCVYFVITELVSTVFLFILMLVFTFF